MTAYSTRGHKNKLYTVAPVVHQLALQSKDYSVVGLAAQGLYLKKLFQGSE